MKLLSIAAAILALAVPVAAQTPKVIDDFESVAAWSSHPSDGVGLEISSDAGLHGRAMRLDFDFHQHGGYAIARRKVDIDLAPNYEITFALRADAPVNNLELKLVDSTGDNVWWLNRRNFQFPREWKEIVTKKRQISFAWGPIGGGEPKHIAAIEIVVTAGTGGKGTVWIDDLGITDLPPSVRGAVRHGPWNAPERTGAPSATRSGAPSATRTGAPSAPTPPSDVPSLTIDLGGFREIGGLHIKWGGDYARDFDVELSRDGRQFRTARSVRSNGRRDEYIYLPEEEASVVRLAMKSSTRGRGYSIQSVEVEPVDWAPTPDDFFAIVAKSSRRGAYPRYLRGEQPYWTIVGADGAVEEALVGEDGNVEPFKAGFSIEPFVVTGGKTITWSDVKIEHSLAERDLPIPSVTWTAAGLTLTTTAAVTDSSMLLVRYRVKATKPSTLYLAIRPFQVNPSTQFLNTEGGVAPIHAIAFDSDHVLVNNDLHVRPLTAPTRFVAAAWDEGEIVDVMQRRDAASSVSDPFGYASGALAFDVPAGERTIDLEVPLEHTSRPITDPSAELQRIAASWREKLHRVPLTIPGAPEVADTVRTSLAYTLIERDGPALEPGSRSYDRAWIRDGSLLGAMLLRLGHTGVAKEFAEWFAGFQYPNGKVPCCVDSRGADPVPENDSHGELIYLVAEIYRQTHDKDFLRRMWPHVDGAARYIDELRSPNHGEFEGLLTESISHEGYSAKPMHSYWDDVFGLRGVLDAAWIAGELGNDERRRELTLQGESFRIDLAASIRRVIATHRIDYVPASAELGDFDPTSTAIGISPLGLASIYPRPELLRTYDEYMARLEKPRKDYTPYEMRIIGALVRLGQRDRAIALIDRFMRDRRPAAWNEWGEVVGTNYREPRFIGDMPHAWVASDFVRSILDTIAFEREDGTLVVGNGVPRKWVDGGTLHAGPFATTRGPIEVRMRNTGASTTIDIDGSQALLPFVLRSPDSRPVRGVRVNGVERDVDGEYANVTELPARVVFSY